MREGAGTRDSRRGTRVPEAGAVRAVNFRDATGFLTRKCVHLWDLRHRFGAGDSLLSSDSTP